MGYLLPVARRVIGLATDWHSGFAATKVTTSQLRHSAGIAPYLSACGLTGLPQDSAYYTRHIRSGRDIVVMERIMAFAPALCQLMSFTARRELTMTIGGRADRGWHISVRPDSCYIRLATLSATTVYPKWPCLMNENP